MPDPIQIRLGGYGPPSTTFSRALRIIGDDLAAEFDDAVEIKYVFNILDLGYKSEDILWLVENGLLSSMRSGRCTTKPRACSAQPCLPCSTKPAKVCRRWEMAQGRGDERSGMDIRAEIAAFDGRHTDVLASIAERLSPDAPTIQELCTLAGRDEPKFQSAATWLLKRIQDDSVAFSPAQVEAVLALLENVSDWEAKLHLLQMMPALTVPKRRAAALLHLLKGKGYLRDVNKFVRAWSYSGLAALAEAHPAHREDVARLLKAGQQDDAASVKARLRNIFKAATWVNLP
ncbi:MAG: hypothetical protein MJE12_18660 [Alphaproteobacteria bacterium]|nr:hypothetical protein [Alphaproteobacteria bacterium]